MGAKKKSPHVASQWQINKSVELSAVNFSSHLQTVWLPSRHWLLLWSTVSLLSHWGQRWTNTLHERLWCNLRLQTANTCVGVQVWRFVGKICKCFNPYFLLTAVVVLWEHCLLHNLSVCFPAHHAWCHWLQQLRDRDQLHHGVVRALSVGELHVPSPQTWGVCTFLVQPGGSLFLWRHRWFALVTEWNTGENRRNNR